MRKALITLLALACIAFAEPYTHDGFFMNYAFGAGYQDFDIKGKRIKDSDISGVATEFDLKLGLSLNPQIIVHLSIASIDNSNEYDNGDVAYASTGVSAFLIGVGATHYMASNIYATASVGAVQLGPSRESEFDLKDGQHGLGVEAGVGKEWWLSDNWGLGLALSLTYVRCTEHGIKYSGLGLNLLLSLTYN